MSEDQAKQEDNVITLPRREAWIGLVSWRMPPEVLAQIPSESREDAMYAGWGGLQKSSLIVSPSPLELLVEGEEIVGFSARFLANEDAVLQMQANGRDPSAFMSALAPGCKLEFVRDVWVGDAPQPEAPPPPLGHPELQHSRCRAMLDLLFASTVAQERLDEIETQLRNTIYEIV